MCIRDRCVCACVCVITCTLTYNSYNWGCNSDRLATCRLKRGKCSEVPTKCQTGLYLNNTLTYNRRRYRWNKRIYAVIIFTVIPLYFSYQLPLLQPPSPSSSSFAFKPWYSSHHKETSLCLNT